MSDHEYTNLIEEEEEYEKFNIVKICTKCDTIFVYSDFLKNYIDIKSLNNYIDLITKECGKGKRITEVPKPIIKSCSERIMENALE